MKSNRFTIFCAAGVLSAAIVCLLTWAAFWRPLGVLRIEQWLYFTPMMAICVGLAAYALLAWARGAPDHHRVWAAVAMSVLVLIILGEHLLVSSSGIERWLFGDASRTLLAGPFAGRPSAMSAICLLFVAGALMLGSRVLGRRLSGADVFAIATLLATCTVALGYLYQAPILLAEGTAPVMTLPEALMLSVLAVGILAMNPHLTAADDHERGVVAARRKLMPAAILIPALFGLAQAMALRAGVLDPVLAVALTSVTGILVSLFLIEWVAGLLAEREAEKEGEHLRRETKAREEGMTDALTGLLNRRGWEHRFTASEEVYRRTGGNACVIVIDLDGLKQLNDTQGHAVGDALIRRAARALESAGRREDFVARLGGDEFAYLAVDCAPQHAEVVMARLTASLQRANVQASLGYAMRDLAGSLPNAFKEADEAMYANKRARKAARKQA